MKTILASLLLTLLALAAPGARAATLDDANAAFAAGKYHESTAAYLDVLAKSGYSSSVLFDLGNSYYREGNYPQAVLAYRRALRLAPGDDDIVANLQAAQRQIGTAVEKEPRYTRVTHLLSGNGWAWLACVEWTLLCLCLLGRAVWPAWRGLFIAAAGAFAMVLGAAVAAAVLDSRDLSEAVVIDKNPQALISPFPAAQSVFAPVPGETVRMEQSYNDFVLVKDRAGHEGWMPKSQIAPVVPPA